MDVFRAMVAVTRSRCRRKMNRYCISRDLASHQTPKLNNNHQHCTSRATVHMLWYSRMRGHNCVLLHGVPCDRTPLCTNSCTLSSATSYKLVNTAMHHSYNTHSSTDGFTLAAQHNIGFAGIALSRTSALHLPIPVLCSRAIWGPSNNYGNLGWGNRPCHVLAPLCRRDTSQNVTMCAPPHRRRASHAYIQKTDNSQQPLSPPMHQTQQDIEKSQADQVSSSQANYDCRA